MSPYRINIWFTWLSFAKKSSISDENKQKKKSVMEEKVSGFVMWKRRERELLLRGLNSFLLICLVDWLLVNLKRELAVELKGIVSIDDNVFSLSIWIFILWSQGKNGIKNETVIPLPFPSLCWRNTLQSLILFKQKRIPLNKA